MNNSTKMSRKIGLLFRQFSFFRALGIVISEATCIILDRFRYPTYAQNGEDKILLWLIRHYQCNSTFYVDIGCNHPKDKSNTFLLYRMGWKGLCVDANPRLVKLFAHVRPKDSAECACVGVDEGNVQFVIEDDPALSHVTGKGSAQSHVARGTSLEMPVKQLSALMHEHSVPRRFGLLSIDVEGMDTEILSSLDLTYWRPHVIVVEIFDLDLPNCASNPLVKRVLSQGYRLVAFSAENAFFVDTLTNKTS